MIPVTALTTHRTDCKAIHVTRIYLFYGISFTLPPGNFTFKQLKKLNFQESEPRFANEVDRETNDARYINKKFYLDHGCEQKREPPSVLS